MGLFKKPQKDSAAAGGPTGSLKIAVGDAAFSFPGAYNMIADFGKSNMLPSGLVKRIQLAFEELVQQILMPVMNKPDILFTVVCPDTKEGADVAVEYSGNPVDPEKTNNRLALMILKSVVSAIECATVPGAERENTIRMQIR